MAGDRWTRDAWWQIPLLAIAYVVAGRVGLLLGELPTGVTPLWPPVGIALGALILAGRRLWPGVVLGSIALDVGSGIPVATMLPISIVVTAQVWLVAWFLETRTPFDPALRRVGDITRLIGYGAIGGALIGATLGTTVLTTTGFVAAEAWGPTWVTWAFGDLFGILVLTPAILLAPSVQTQLQTSGRIAEGTALLFVLLIIHLLAYSGRLSGVLGNQELFAVFPAFVYAGLRFQTHGAALANLMTGIVAPIATAAGIGPFAGQPTFQASLFALDGVLLLIIPTSLFFGAVIQAELDARSTIRDQATRIRTMVDHSPIGIMTLGADGRILQASRACAEQTKHDAQKLAGRPFAELVHPDHAGRLQRLFDDVQHGRRSEGIIDVRMRRPGATSVWSRARLVPIHEGDDPESHVLVLLEDLTAHVAARQAELEREEHEARLERMKAEGKWRDQVFTVAAHEIRNPLTPIHINTTLLADGHFGPLNAKQKSVVAGIRREVKRVEALLSDILDASRLQRGGILLQPKHLDLVGLIETTVDDLQPYAGEKGVRLTSTVPTELELDADPARITQVVYNLVQNAIKFTPSGNNVMVRLDSAPGTATIHIVDEGPGIAPEAIDTVFDAYVQSDDTGEHKEGLGLGLFIARTIVRQHGGDILCRNRTNGPGLEMVVSLPTVPSTKDAQASPRKMDPGHAHTPASHGTPPDPDAAPTHHP